MKWIFRGVVFIILFTTGCNREIEPTKEPPENSATSSPSAFIQNPATYYCSTVMKYEYQIVTEADGSQKGECTMPNSEVCDQWAFYAGECGADYSYCAQEGLSIKTYSDGQDPYAQTYGVCVDSKGQVQFKISDLFPVE